MFRVIVFGTDGSDTADLAVTQRLLHIAPLPRLAVPPARVQAATRMESAREGAATPAH